MQAGADVKLGDDQGLTSLHTACMLNEGKGAAMVEKLLAANADPLQQDNHGRHALDIAREYDDSNTNWWKESFMAVAREMMRQVPTRDYEPE